MAENVYNLFNEFFSGTSATKSLNLVNNNPRTY